MDYHEVTLETFNSGAILDLFEAEWKRLLDNIKDPNTKPDAVRRIKIEVSVKPDKERSHANTMVSVKFTPVPIQPDESFIVLSLDKSGRLQAYTTDPRQQDLDLDGDKITTFNTEAQ